MADGFSMGPKLKIDGEADFKKALADINKNLTVFGSEMKKVTAQFGDNKDSLESLTAKSDVYNKQIAEQKNRINLLKEALAGAAKEYGENSDQVKEWQIKLNNAEAVLSKTESNLEDNERAIKNLGKSVDDAGERYTKFSGVLKSAAVAVGAIAVAAAAAAAKMGQEVVKQFSALEQNLGGSESVFGEYALSIQKTGEDAYKNLGLSQSEYLANANKMGALLQGSGISQQESLSLTERAMQRAADMASVMGIETSAAMEAVTGAAKGNYTMMDNLGVKMDDTSVKAFAMANGFKGTWSEASNAEKAQYAMQMFFDSTSQYAGNFARESTETISGSIGMLKAAAGSFIAGLGNADADMKNLTGNMVDAFQAVVKNIKPVLENIIEAMPTVISGLTSALVDMLPTLLKSAVSLFNEVLTTLISLLPTLIPVAVDALLTLVDTLIENLPLLINAALQIIQSLATGIAQSLPTLIPSIVKTVMTIVETLIDNIDMLVDAAIAIIMGLADGMITALPVLIDKLPVIIDKLITAIFDNLPKLLQMVITLNIEMAKAMIKAVPQLLSKIPEIIESLVQGFKNMLPQVGQIGLNLVQGIWSGITNATQWIIDKIKGFASSIVNSIKNFFGIHSPSSLFRDQIGKNLALGIGEGFSAEMKSVARMMNSSVPTLFDVGINGSGQTVGYSTSNLIVDGSIMASVTSKNQYRRNQAMERTYGLIPT